MYFATKLLLSAEQQLIGRVERAEAVHMHAAWEKSMYQDLNSLWKYLSPIHYDASQTGLWQEVKSWSFLKKNKPSLF